MSLGGTTFRLAAVPFLTETKFAGNLSGRDRLDPTHLNFNVKQLERLD
jgi:hypothetical protein